jgi:hypothetical protein
MDWSEAEWARRIWSPEWAPKVVDALRRICAEGSGILEPVTLVSAELETTPEQESYVLAIYDHAWWDRRTGLRRKLNRIPMTVPPGMPPEEALALDIAQYDIAEPLGNYWDLLVEDEDGVWWWGDGYPELTTDLNAPWYADLPKGGWRRPGESWTVAASDEAVCGRAAVADGEVLNQATLLMPPQPVYCVRPKGHAGVHGSASRSKHSDESELEVFGWD